LSADHNLTNTDLKELVSSAIKATIPAQMNFQPKALVHRLPQSIMLCQLIQLCLSLQCYFTYVTK